MLKTTASQQTSFHKQILCNWFSCPELFSQHGVPKFWLVIYPLRDSVIHFAIDIYVHFNLFTLISFFNKHDCNGLDLMKLTNFVPLLKFFSHIFQAYVLMLTLLSKVLATH